MAAGWLAWVVLGKDKSLTKDRKPNWAALLAVGIAVSLVGGIAVSLLTREGFEFARAG